MTKLIGIVLIFSSVLALVVGAFIDIKYGTNAQITGNAISNIISQPEVKLYFFDYSAGIIFSYAIVSFIMGIVFLFRI